MHVLITGASGFIGKNLYFHLQEHKDISVIQFTRKDSIESLKFLVAKVDFIIHLAGENRPKETIDFKKVNIGLTSILCEAVKLTGRLIPIIFTSSVQVDSINPYGESKLAAEVVLEEFHEETANPIYIYRLQNVFGKWCKPNYNSVVATFCHNIANNLPISITDGSKIINLIYIDDLISSFLGHIKSDEKGIFWPDVNPKYTVKLDDLANLIKEFKQSRENHTTMDVGSGFFRALYSTYLSYIQPKDFSYSLPFFSDERGIFVESLKTQNSGQFSYFTAYPGITRGGHYHLSLIHI